MMILGRLWNDRWLILLIAGSFLAAGVAYSVWGPRWYQAKVVLLPAANGGLPAGLSQFSGLASLAGLNLTEGADSQLPLAVLGSRDFARRFIEENRLLTVLLADRWDAENQSWKRSIFRSDPDMRSAVDLFVKQVRGVSEDKRAGVVSLTMTWRSPELAWQWANSFVGRLNEWMRDDAVRRAQENVGFLQEELTKSTVPALQQSLGRVLEAEMQKLLLARGNSEYAFRVVDPAFVPRKPVTPPLAILVLSLLAGMVVGVSVSAARWIRRDIGKLLASQTD